MSYENEHSLFPDKDLSSSPTPDVSSDLDKPITTLYKKVSQTNSGQPRQHAINTPGGNVPAQQDQYATTNLRGQLATIRQEKDLAMLHTKDQRAKTSATPSLPSDDFYSDTSIPELPFKADGSADFNSHIDNLKNRLIDSKNNLSMLYIELKSARIYEIRYYESDTRLAENQIRLVEKDSELADLQSRFDESDKKNDELLEKNILLRSWLAELENQRADLVKIPILEEKISEQEKQLDEHKSLSDKTESIESELDEKNQEIEDLRIELSNTESLNLSLRAKDVEINDLRQEVQQISQLETSLCEKNLELVQVNAEAFKAKEYASELVNKEAEIERLQKNKSEKHALESQLETKTWQIDELREQLKTMNALKIKVQQYENKIQVLNLELSNKDSELTNILHNSEQQKNEHIKTGIAQSTKTAELNTLIAQLEKFKISTNTLSSKLSEKEKEASKLSAEILALSNLKIDLLNKDQPIDHLQNTSQQLTTETDELSQLESSLNAHEKEKEKEIEQLANYAKRLADRDAAITQLKNDLTQKAVSQPDHFKVTVKETESSSQQAHLDFDDLKLIRGIRPVIEKTLNDFGITTFKQVSDLSNADIKLLSKDINGLKRRIKRDNWVENAKRQHAKKYNSEA